MTAVAYAKWIGAAVLLVLYSAFWYHLGGEGTRLKVANTEIKQAAAEQRKDTKDQATVEKEAKTYEAATDPLTPIAAPAVRMCYYSTLPTVPSAHPSGSGADASTPLPAAAPADPLPGPDIGRPLVQVGHNADAQVAGLQDYIEHVCQAKAP